MGSTTTGGQPAYYIPQPSHWPITGSVALLLLGMGAAFWFNGVAAGPWLAAAGFAVLLVMLFGWFGTVIGESESRLYSKRVDVSFRWSMSWFIFSEVMFFAAFFGALFYVRNLSVPDLAAGSITGNTLWPNYAAQWPTAGPYGTTPFTPMGAIGIPLLNTILLLSSGVTLTIAHHALKAGERGKLAFWLAATIVLGFTFLGFQAYEYIHAPFGFKDSIYGATFFMATGFHGFHVLVGTIFLLVCLFRAMAGHFTAKQHFGFEAAAWYWHFVDVVWLFLFAAVYVWASTGATIAHGH